MFLISDNNSKYFSYWLKGSIFLIFLMIVVGGLTRLTDSGLSITKWELISGILPPLSSSDWLAYFNEYKKIPQFLLLYPNMTLSEFKVIFFWEYFHRLLGRIIGLFFILPLIYFTFKKQIIKKDLIIFYFVFFLICLQGFFGWFMVESGLVDDVTVSHYRLAIHLFTAVIILSILYWSFLNYSNKTTKKFFSFIKNNLILKFFFLLILIQIIFGAFVSGLDAGRIYQTWPMMNNSFFPDDTVLNGPLDLLNFNNESLVQFYHRSFAYLIIIFFLYIFLKSRDQKFRVDIKSLNIVALVLLAQIILGILTLVSGLNLYLAIFHQFLSLVLLLSVLRLNFFSNSNDN